MSHYLAYRYSPGRYPGTHRTQYATSFHTWGDYQCEGKPFRSLAKACAFARKMNPDGIEKIDAYRDRIYFNMDGESVIDPLGKLLDDALPPS